MLRNKYLILLILSLCLLSSAHPSVFIPPLKSPVTIGDDITLLCHVKNLDNFTLIWKFTDPTSAVHILTAGNIRVSSDDRISSIHDPDDDVWLLKIRNASTSDSGIYVCEVNSSPKIGAALIVKVDEDERASLFSRIDHNYTECCIHENVPSVCHGFCHFKGLIFDNFQKDDGPSPSHVAQKCVPYLQQITKCLIDGRDHVPCCRKRQLPNVCLPLCAGNFTITSVVDHFACMDYSASLLSCIAEGVETLPSIPENISVNPISPTKLLIKWNPPKVKLVDWYQINITQLDSFDQQPSSDETQPPLHGLHISTKINASLVEFTATNLKPFTMYEITMRSMNKYGSSLTSNAIRSITLNPSRPAPLPVTDIPKLPDTKACCIKNGVTSERCSQILCDPVRADEIALSDIIICAPWANITFKCMANEVNHTECCRSRGVSPNCMPFCQGAVTKVDFHHFVCLEHMSTFSNCILDHYGVLPDPPHSLVITNIHSDWAICEWNPPIRLGSTVTGYHLYLQEVREDSKGYNFTAVKHSPYLLNHLKPSTRYEVFVASVNKYGVSRGSSRVIFSTLPKEEVEEVRQEPIYNETACCVSARVIPKCLPLCSYQVKVADVIKLSSVCTSYLPNLVRCGAGGRYHVPCCRRRGVSNSCLNLCAGMTDYSPVVTAMSCSQDLGSILECMEEGSVLIPSMPIDLHVVYVNATFVHLKWNVSEQSASSFVFQVRYEATNGVLHPLQHAHAFNTTKPEAKLVLEEGSYSMYVVAMNDYGISLPSLIVLVNTTASVGKPTIGPPHSIEVLLQTVDSLTFKWLPPLFMLPDRSVSYIIHYKPINGTEMKLTASTQWINILTNYNSMIITNLTYNTQYAIALRARTDRGEISPLSEMLLVWTDQVVPATVNLPLIIPSGDVREGSNVTVLCVGDGSPLPKLIVMINGEIVRTGEGRSLSWSGVMTRNVTSVECISANGYGDDLRRAMSSAQVSVHFKPKVRALGPFVANTGEIAKLECEVTGNRMPHVIWYKKNDNLEEITNGPRVTFFTLPQPYEPYKWKYTILIKAITKEDAGEYSCKAENDMGNHMDTLELKVYQNTKNQTKSYNCCKSKRLSSECLEACKYDVDIEIVNSKPQCIDHLDSLIYCASEGSDHRSCCRSSFLPPQCLRWCAGLPIANPLPCLPYLSALHNCFTVGTTLLPSPPIHLRATRLPTSIQLKWDPPIKNPELVSNYRIFWRLIGSRTLHRNTTNSTSFVIEELQPNGVYEVVLKSGSLYGLSVYTDPLVVGRLPNETKTGILMGLIILIFLIIGAGVYAGIKGYNKIIGVMGMLSKSERTGVSFENPSYLKDGQVEIRGKIDSNGNGVEGDKAPKAES